MRSNFLSVLLCCLSVVLFTNAHAQSKEQCLSMLNQKAKEIVGQIKIVNSSRFVVDDAYFTMKNNEVTIFFKSGKDEYYYYFSPQDIDEIEDGNANASSPVGTIKIILEEDLGRREADLKKSSVAPYYNDIVYFNYLKKDPKNFGQIQKLLLKLQELTTEEPTKTSMAHLLDEHITESEIWTSAKSVSYTYEPLSEYYSGCSLKFFYKMEKVTLSTTVDDLFLAVIPMDNIDELMLDKKAARPASYWLKSGKSGFQIYKFDTKEKNYVYYGEQEKVPLFVEDSKGVDHDHFVNIIETAMKNCGGGKLKVRVND